MTRKNNLRKNPSKKQNNYGGDYDCYNFEEREGKEWCHDEGNNNWNEWVKWNQTDKNGELKCKGNRHNCIKLKLRWLASLSEKEKVKYLNGGS